MNRSLSITRFLQKNSLSSYDDGTKRLKGRKAEKKMYHKESAGHGDISELSKEEMKTIRRSQVPLVSDTLMHLRTRDMLPTIWFVFSRRGCDEAVEYLEDSSLLNDEEQLKVYLALKEFRAQYLEAVRENAVMYLLQGVAAHHAGCLPLWKSFIEELFQQGLIKVVFATETLAAGINMPARTTVLSSVSKRGDNGHSLLTSNALLQMAGRAGRRSIDNEGHVVVVQTPFEGAEECCKLLFAGPDPLVSQFSASYGMVLNLLVARRLTLNNEHPNRGNAVRMGRTLQEARALIEKSFGNYVSSEVMIAMKDQLEKLPVILVAARSTIGAMSILAHIIASKCDHSYVEQGFPDSLFHQLLQAMTHLDVETHVTSHRIFTVLLVATSVSLSGSQHDSKRTFSKPTLAFASATALFKKLKKEKVGSHDDKNGSEASDETKERDGIEEKWRQDGFRKSPTRFYSINLSIPDMQEISSSSMLNDVGAMWLLAASPFDNFLKATSVITNFF